MYVVINSVVFESRRGNTSGTGDWSSDVFFFFKQKTAYELIW